MSQDPLTPGVSQKTYTKSQPLNSINQMVDNTPHKKSNKERDT